MRYITILLLFTSLFTYGQEKNSKGSKSTLFDSIKSVSRINTVDTFDIQVLQTDDYSKMAHINEKFFNMIYPERDDYSKNTYFIYSYLSTNDDYLTLFIYQRNFEGENYRVDYIDLINIDTNGNKLDGFRLTAIDNQVITYEVVSTLSKDTLIINEQYSSEYYKDMDTLYINKHTFILNGKKRIEKITENNKYKIRYY